MKIVYFLLLYSSTTMALNIQINGTNFTTSNNVDYFVGEPKRIKIQNIVCEPSILEPNRILLNMQGMDVATMASFNYFPSTSTIVITTDHPINCIQDTNLPNLIFKNGFEGVSRPEVQE